MRRKKRAIKVTLRTRMLNTGKEALYLDFYPPIVDQETKLKSRRESLGMFIYPLKNRNGDYHKDKNGNYKYNSSCMETMRLAEIIRNNKQNEFDKENIYTETEAEILKAKKPKRKNQFVFVISRYNGARALKTIFLVLLVIEVKTKNWRTIRHLLISLN